MSSILGSTFSIKVKKSLMKVDRKNKKQRIYLSSRNTVKSIGPLPIKVDNRQTKIKLQQQTGHDVYFIYNPEIEELKLFVRHTML